jgi:GntR family transcriptional regulator
MKWTINSERPVYRQLIEQIEGRIISGIYKSGERLPSVRDLATEASVNPNTMQRALANLEQSGLVYSKRTSGRFITEDQKMIEGIKKEMALSEIKNFIEKMNKMGFDRQAIIALIQKEGVTNE